MTAMNLIAVDGHRHALALAPSALMLLATVLWLTRAGRRRGQESDAQVASRDLELMLVCLLLNVAALLLWGALAPATMLRCWALQAAASGVLNLLSHLARRPWLTWTLRPSRWAAGYALIASSALLFSVPGAAIGG